MRSAARSPIERPAKRIEPAVRRYRAADSARQRRLAGTVRAQQRHGLARAHREVDAAQRAHAAVIDGRAADFQQRRRRRGHRARPRSRGVGRARGGVTGAQVHRRHLRIRQHLARISHEQHLPRGQHRGALAAGGDHVHHVLDQHDGLDLGADRAYQCDERAGLTLDESGTDLVQQQQPWPQSQRARQLQPLAPQQRQRSSRLPGDIGKTGALENVLAALLHGLPMTARRAHGAPPAPGSRARSCDRRDAGSDGYARHRGAYAHRHCSW